MKAIMTAEFTEKEMNAIKTIAEINCDGIWCEICPLSREGRCIKFDMHAIHDMYAKDRRGKA